MKIHAIFLLPVLLNFSPYCQSDLSHQFEHQFDMNGHPMMMHNQYDYDHDEQQMNHFMQMGGGHPGMPQFQHQQNVKFGPGGYGMQHQSTMNVNYGPMMHGGHEMPPEPMPQHLLAEAAREAPPAPEPSAPPEPVEDDGIEPMDKPQLLDLITHVYQEKCRSSSVLTMPEPGKKALVAQSKKLPLEMANYEWAVDVDRVCDFLEFVPGHTRKDCFELPMPLTREFQKALQMHGISYNDYSYGPLYFRVLACKLMRKFEAEELKETRALHNDELKKGIVNVMLDEHKATRGMPPPSGPWDLHLGSPHHAGLTFWELAVFVNRFHMQVVVHQMGNACHVVHGDEEVFAEYQKYTNGIDPEFDAAIHRLKEVMAKVPLTLTEANRREFYKHGEENCTYDLFLFRPLIELFLAIINAIELWLHKFGNYAHSYLCPVWEPYCAPGRLMEQIAGYKMVALENAHILSTWFAGRDHGKIHEDYAEYEQNHVAGKFRVHIPDPPPQQKMKIKTKMQTADGTYMKSKIVHDPVARQTRMKTTMHQNHPYGGAPMVMKNKMSLDHGQPHPFGGAGPGHFDPTGQHPMAQMMAAQMLGGGHPHMMGAMMGPGGVHHQANMSMGAGPNHHAMMSHSMGGNPFGLGIGPGMPPPAHVSMHDSNSIQPNEQGGQTMKSNKRVRFETRSRFGQPAQTGQMEMEHTNVMNAAGMPINSEMKMHCQIGDPNC